MGISSSTPADGAETAVNETEGYAGADYDESRPITVLGAHHNRSHRFPLCSDEFLLMRLRKQEAPQRAITLSAKSPTEVAAILAYLSAAETVATLREMPTQRQLQLAADEDLDLVERDWYCASLILQAMGDDEQEATLAAMTREERHVAMSHMY